MRLIDADALCEDLMRRWSVAETRKEKLIKAVMADFVTPIVVSQPTIEPERQGRWIPCSERLPDKEKETYWICTDTEHQCECRWTNNVYGFGESDRWGWSIFDIPHYTKVSAWMPLPEPYKEGEQK